MLLFQKGTFSVWLFLFPAELVPGSGLQARQVGGEGGITRHGAAFEQSVGCAGARRHRGARRQRLMKRGSLKTVRLLHASCGLPRSWLRCCLLNDPLSGCLKTKRKTWRSLGKRVGVKAPSSPGCPRVSSCRWWGDLPETPSVAGCRARLLCQLRNGLCMRGCCRTICRDAFWQLVRLFLLYLKIPYRENESN